MVGLGKHYREEAYLQELRQEREDETGEQAEEAAKEKAEFWRLSRQNLCIIRSQN